MNRLLALVLLLSLFLPASVMAERHVVARELLMRKKLRNPIVLVHGATTKGSTLQIGFLDLGDYFYLIPEYYKATGTPVKVAQLTTDGSIGERAAVLKNFLETEMKGQMVNIVAHSLGGLDARYAVSVLGSTQIASITTVGTPHRGTPLANWAERQVRYGSAWYWFFRLIGYDMAKRRFLKEITTVYMRDVFNPKVKDSWDVRYFSINTAASFDEFNMSHLLWFPSWWMEREDHPMTQAGHDGMVPLTSQAWGKVIGTFRADHLTQINHHAFRSSDESDISYNIYRVIYDNLSNEGL